MSHAEKYKLLVLTSDPENGETIEAVAREHFPSVQMTYWEFGNADTKSAAMQAVEEADYNLIISHVNGLILKKRHLAKAEYGAINIHPAPPEHGGLWGLWCQPVIRRDFRTHHGVLAHEMDEHIDHGPIYRVVRWPVSTDDTIQQVFEQSVAACLRLYEEICAELAASPNGTGCFSAIAENWHPHNRYHSVDDVRQWFAGLDPSHPAHAERVWLNHPRGIAQPPYFDDMQDAPAPVAPSSSNPKRRTVSPATAGRVGQA